MARTRCPNMASEANAVSTIHTTRRDFLKVAGAAAAVAPLARAHGGANPKRNVVLYVVDDQGMDDAGCYGHPVIRTPGLNELAAHGTRFTSAFCTAPSCSPSRAVMLTGLHTHANGQYGLAHAYHHFASFGHVQSLPAILSSHGYRTVVAGKYHIAPPAVYPFDEIVPVRTPDALVAGIRPHLEADDARPFFMVVATVEPHRPFRNHLVDEYAPDAVIVPDYLPDTPECREELAAYYGSTQQADLGLVKLIEALRETGHWDDTLVIHVSDNGIAFPGAKTNLYEPGVRLPCVVRNPLSNRRGATCHAMVTWCDLTPTILDYAGLLGATGLPEFQGRSFLSAMEVDDPEGWDEVFLSHTFHEVTMYYPMRCLRERRYKLIWNIAHQLEFPFASDLHGSATWQGILQRGDTHYGRRSVNALLHRPEFELYDLEADPDEVVNLAGDSDHAELLATLKAKLRAHQEQTEDPWVLKWDRE
jgi:N-sulfoglucosamine sulfohydrolase